MPPSRSFFLFLPSFPRPLTSLTHSQPNFAAITRRSVATRRQWGGWTDGATHARTDRQTYGAILLLRSLSRSFGSCSCVARSLLLLAPFRQPDRHPASRHGDGRRWQLTDRRKRPMRRRPSVSARLTSSALSLLGPKRNRFAKEDVDHLLSKHLNSA